MFEISAYYLDGKYSAPYQISEGEGNIRFNIESAPDDAKYVVLGGIIAPVIGGTATLDVRSLPNGDYEPVAVTEMRSVHLPRIKKSGKKISLAPYTAEQLGKMECRICMLERRIAELEAAVGRINGEIGKKLF